MKIGQAGDGVAIDDLVVHRNISEPDADLWEAFKNGGPWVAHSEYMKLQAENERLRELCHDMLAVIIGWSWKLNELAGYRLDDEDTYPSRVMRGFIDRARELEVPL